MQPLDEVEKRKGHVCQFCVYSLLNFDNVKSAAKTSDLGYPTRHEVSLDEIG